MRKTTLGFGMSLMCWMLLLSACSAPRVNPRWTYVEGAPVRGDVAQKRLALIFTGGEHGEGTTHILNVLAAAKIRASFFVTGDYLAVPGHPALVRRMVNEGHYVGPHSHAHPLYCAWDDRAHTLVTEKFFRDDLERNIADLRRLGALRHDEPVYFIPPYEWYNADQTEWAAAMGIALFNFTPGSGSNRDWIPEGHAKFASSRDILADILRYERQDPHGMNGFLLLLHLGALREDKMHLRISPLIDELHNRGYTFARVDEILPGAGLRHP